MSLDLGKPFTLGFNDVSDDRFNAKMWTIDTSDNLFNGVKIPGQFMLPTNDGNGFSKNVPCFRDVDDAENIISLGVKKHTHAGDTEAEGGLLGNAFINNVGNLHTWFGNTFIDTDFFKNTNGTGALVQTTTTATTAYVECDTGTSTDGYANIRKMGLTLDFGKYSVFSARMELNGTIANYVLRSGVNGEMINNANDPTTKSYGIEACSGQTNWQTWSCDGTTRSTVATSYAVDTSIHTWLALHDPTVPNIQFSRDVDTANTVTKTSNIPTSGGTDTVSLFSSGVKSTTSSQAKEWRFRGAVVYGFVGTSGWKWYLF
jgi:hypothetical protein